jgi:hypothetical protein
MCEDMCSPRKNNTERISLSQKGDREKGFVKIDIRLFSLDKSEKFNKLCSAW